MTEAELQAAVEHQLREAGLAWHHCPRSQRCRGTPGWPDLLILGPSAALFAELKSADGRRSLAQIRCAAQLARAGLGYRLWRPGDWDAGTIASELEALAHAAGGD